MPYTNDNILALIAKNMKKMKVDTEGSVDAKKLAYDNQSDTFETARAAAQLAFDTAYAAKETAKASAEAASLAASLAAVTAAKDAIVNDDGDASVVNTLEEMEAQINADLAAYNAQKSAYEVALESARTTITTTFGNITEFLQTYDSSYSNVGVNSGSAASGGSTYSIASFIGGTYPNITPTGDAEATKVISPLLIGQTLPVIFSVQNPGGESGIPTATNFKPSTVENIFEHMGPGEGYWGANSTTNIHQGPKDFWAWFVNPLNYPTSTENGSFEQVIKDKWIETMGTAGIFSDNNGDESVYNFLGKAQFAWGNLAKKGYQDTAYTKEQWKEDLEWFFSRMDAAFVQMQGMYAIPGASGNGATGTYNSTYGFINENLRTEFSTFETTILQSLMASDASAYYYNGEGVGENLL